MALSTPAQQAGILSFYDAPEKGPHITIKILLISVIVFTLLVIVLDHIAAI
ncbi:MAG: hypothetical protein QW091_00095 [Candidatus Micrarchaeaceae archaeon]